MKLLTLVRHAKSDWDNDFHDFDRPLNHRGMHDAPAMGQWIKQMLPPADLFLSSSALRAKTTALLIATASGFPEDKIVFTDSLYHCGVRDYLKILELQPEDIKHIIVFSHNPGISTFSTYLCPRYPISFPTCGVVHMNIYANSWSEITKNSGKIEQYCFPSMI